MVTDMTQQLVGAAELVQLLGVNRARAYQISRHPDFPPPVADLIGGKIWDLADVQTWADARGRVLHPLGAASND
jgi:predicted DNA-binding transcriptional regulator AlpA